MTATPTWKLCTATFHHDYFWLDQTLRPRTPPSAAAVGTRGEAQAPPPALFLRITDEVGERCGYYLRTADHVEMAVGPLTTDRRDRGGRSISQSLFLAAPLGEHAAADWIRKIFIEAIATPTTDRVGTAAAELANRLFAMWERQSKSEDIAVPVVWTDYLDALTPRAPAPGPRAEWGHQYSRRQDPAAPARLARLLNEDASTEPCLIVAAMTRSPAAILEAIAADSKARAIPRTRRAFCALSATDDRTVNGPPTDSGPQGIRRPHSGESGHPGVGGTWDSLAKRFGLGLILLIALAGLAYWLLSAPQPPPATATPSIPPPSVSNPTTPSGDTVSVSPSPDANTGHLPVMDNEGSPPTPAAVDRSESPSQSPASP